MNSTIKLFFRAENSWLALEFPVNTTMEKVKKTVGEKFNVPIYKFYLDLNFLKNIGKAILVGSEKKTNIILGSYNKRAEPMLAKRKITLIVPKEKTFEDFQKEFPETYNHIKYEYINNKIYIVEYDNSEKIKVEVITAVKVNNEFQKFSKQIKISQNQTISEIKKTICEKFNKKYNTKRSKEEIKLYYLGKNITKMLGNDDTKTLEYLVELFAGSLYNPTSLYDPITFKFSEKH